MRIYELDGTNEALLVQKWVQSPSTNWVVDRKLMDGDYVWEAVAWSKYGYSAWSAKKSFRIHSLRPLAPQLTLPTHNDEIGSGGLGVYWWEFSNSVEWYQIYVEREGVAWRSLWIPANNVKYDATTARWEAPDHMWGNYRWCVRGWNAYGLGRWSEIRNYSRGKLVSWFGFKWKFESALAPTWYQIDIREKLVPDPVRRNVWVRAEDLIPASGGFSTWVIDPPLPSGSYYYVVRPWRLSRKLGPWETPKTINIP